MPIAAMLLGVAALMISIGWIETRFQRPSLSVRPQVWLSSPVEWTFRTQALLNAATEGDEPDVLRLSFTDFDQLADRYKNGANEPMWSTIQSQVLLETLSEMSLPSLGLRFSVSNGSPIIDFGKTIAIPDFTNDQSDVAVRSSLSIEQVATAIGQRVTLEFVVFVDRCASRESRVFCPLADFAGADLRRGDFERANLRGTDITGANFNGAKLGFADLSGSIGSNVDMSSAWLVGVDIGDAFLKDVEYQGAVWTR